MQHTVLGFEKILGKFGHDDELHQSLQELFPSSSSDEKLEDMMILTKAYHTYKMKYMKHLSFSPKKENLSKAIFINQHFINLFQPQCLSMPH